MEPVGDRWEVSAAYFSCYPLPRPGWAWEYVRRHPGYRTAYATALRQRRNPTEDDDAAAWGLMLFEDPDIPASEALVLWRADAQPGMLRTLVRTASTPDRALDFWAEPGRKAAALTQAGLVVLVERAGAQFRLWFDNAHAFGGTLDFDLRIGAPPDGIAEMDTARAFLRSFLTDRPASAVDPHAPYLARYLQALDGRQAGASYTEIGRAISVGDRSVEGQHGAATAKSRGRDAVERGLFLRNGGYRLLLQPPPVALFAGFDRRGKS